MCVFPLPPSAFDIISSGLMMLYQLPTYSMVNGFEHKLQEQVITEREISEFNIYI